MDLSRHLYLGTSGLIYGSNQLDLSNVLMNPMCTKDAAETWWWFLVIHWPSRNLVEIGMHGSLYDLYATRLTQTSPKPLPDLGRLPRPCGTHCMPPHTRGTRKGGADPNVDPSGPHIGKIREREEGG